MFKFDKAGKKIKPPKKILQKHLIEFLEKSKNNNTTERTKNHIINHGEIKRKIIDLTNKYPLLNSR